MEIIIGKTAGFCYGVNRAVTKTIEELKNIDNQQIYCLGELVHNKQVVEKVENMGLKVISDVEHIPDKQSAKVIIRAHGVEPKVYENVKQRKHDIVDLTCPNVLAIHKLAENFSKENVYVFLIGQKNHPEVIGTYGFCKDCTIIEKQEDIQEAIKDLKQSKAKKLAIIGQTTFSLEKFQQYAEQIQEELKQNYEVEIRNTICNATKLRQEETEELSKKVDYMIIIGGRNSSNTKKLFDIASKNCKETICIETQRELDLENIKKVETKILQNKTSFVIGIMAGASTPKESIENVEIALKNI